MNIKSKLTLPLIAAFAATCSGADFVRTAALPVLAATNTLAVTNVFGDSSAQWKNMTLGTACPPWGCTRAFVISQFTDPYLSLPPQRRKTIQHLDERLQELHREDQLRRQFSGPAFSEVYRVTLSKANFSTGEKP